MFLLTHSAALTLTKSNTPKSFANLFSKMSKSSTPASKRTHPNNAATAISKEVSKEVVSVKAMAVVTVATEGLNHQQLQLQQLQGLQEPAARLTTPLNMLSTTVDKIRTPLMEVTRTMLHTTSTTRNKLLSNKVQVLLQVLHLLPLQLTMRLHLHHQVVLRLLPMEATTL